MQDDGLRAGLQALSQQLGLALSAGAADSPEVQRAKHLAPAVAVVSADVGLEEDAAWLKASLGFRVVQSGAPSLSELNEALGHLVEAAALVRARSGEAADAALTATQIFSAVAWTRMQGVDSGAAVMAAMREAASRCPRGTDWLDLQADLLQVWTDLLRHPTLKEGVEPDDVRGMSDLASALLADSSVTIRQRYWATLALALALLHSGDATTALTRLREAAQLAEGLDDPVTNARCQSILADELVRALGTAAHHEAVPLKLAAAAAFAAADQPFESADCYRVAAVMAIEDGDWEAALDPLRRSLVGWETALDRATLPERASRVTVRLAYAHQALALCLVHLDRLEEAAVAADAGRARRLRSMPRQFWPGIARVRERAPLLAEQFFAAHRRLREAEAALRSLDAGDEHGPPIDAASAALEELGTAKAECRDKLDQVRAVPGVEGVFDERSLERIRSTLPAGAIAAYVVPSPHGGVAILVGEATLDAVLLPELTNEALSGALKAGAVALDRWRSRPGDPVAVQAWQDAISAGGSWAWETFMGTLLERCRAAARLILLPAGGLEFLPLHAAWCAGADGRPQYALDVLPISYAPCADLQPAAHDAGPIEDRPMLLVADPAPVSAVALELARAEAGAIAAAFSETRLEGATATKDAILKALPAADLIHLACHGHVEFGDPYASYLLAACDKHLELSDIVDHELSRRPFVFLSACESGLHDIELADEVQSLAAGFLAAGASAVISTLWSVFDISGLLVAVMVYDRRLAGADGLAALRHAQQWMRDATIQEMAAAVRAMAWIEPDLRASIADRVATLPVELSSPLYWAPYFYCGS
jgi:hypothetical protein